LVPLASNPDQQLTKPLALPATGRVAQYYVVNLGILVLKAEHKKKHYLEQNAISKLV
jgi:hypothetical protein